MALPKFNALGNDVLGNILKKLDIKDKAALRAVNKEVKHDVDVISPKLKTMSTVNERTLRRIVNTLQNTSDPEAFMNIRATTSSDLKHVKKGQLLMLYILNDAIQKDPSLKSSLSVHGYISLSNAHAQKYTFDRVESRYVQSYHVLKSNKDVLKSNELLSAFIDLLTSNDIHYKIYSIACKGFVYTYDAKLNMYVQSPPSRDTGVARTTRTLQDILKHMSDTVMLHTKKRVKWHGKFYRLRTGPRGGTFIVVQGKKIYRY